jgi:hypothetical protein
MADRPPIIDADGHIQERAEDIRKYLEPPWNRRLGGLTPGDQPWDRDIFHNLGRYPGYTRELGPAQQVELWLKIMDEYAIEEAVLFPTGSAGVANLREIEYAHVVCRATNNHLGRDFNALSDRIHVVGVLPLQDPPEAARELRRAVTDLGLVSFELIATGLPFPLGDRFYDPLYEEAQRLEVPLCIHGSPSHSQEMGAGGLRTFNEVHTYTFPAGVLLQFTSVIFQGVPVRFPRLRLSFLEIGATWLPYWLDRMDEHWELRGEWEAPLLKKKPSEIVREAPIYVSLEEAETMLPQAVEYLGTEHFMYATDIPHWDSEFPEGLEKIWGHPGLSRDAKEHILYHNAKAFYGLGARAAVAPAG